MSAQLKSELEFFLQFKKNPQKFELIKGAINEGILSATCQHPKLRELYAFMKDNEGENPIMFNYKLRKWEIAPQTMQVMEYAARAQSLNGDWKNNLIMLSSRKLPGSNTRTSYTVDRNGMIAEEDVPINFLLGVEYEIHINKKEWSDRGGVYWEIIDTLGGKSKCLAKRDATLNSGNHGIEIVTVPRTLQDLKDSFTQLYTCGVQDKLDFNRRLAGIHIHVGRHSLTPHIIAKLLHFVHNPHNNWLFKEIGGRGIGDNNYCTYVVPAIFEEKYKTPLDIFKIKVNKTGSEGALLQVVNDNFSDFKNHYGALSISKTNPTLEFRMFNQTSSKEVMLSYLELVHSIVSWAQESAVLDTSVDSYITWLFDYTNTRYKTKDRKPDYSIAVSHPLYPNLVRRLKKILGQEREKIPTQNTTAMYTNKIPFVTLPTN